MTRAKKHLLFGLFVWVMLNLYVLVANAGDTTTLCAAEFSGAKRDISLDDVIEHTRKINGALSPTDLQKLKIVYGILRHHTIVKAAKLNYKDTTDASQLPHETHEELIVKASEAALRLLQQDDNKAPVAAMASLLSEDIFALFQYEAFYPQRPQVFINDLVRLLEPLMNQLRSRFGPISVTGGRVPLFGPEDILNEVKRPQESAVILNQSSHLFPKSDDPAWEAISALNEPDYDSYERSIATEILRSHTFQEASWVNWSSFVNEIQQSFNSKLKKNLRCESCSTFLQNLELRNWAREAYLETIHTRLTGLGLELVFLDHYGAGRVEHDTVMKLLASRRLFFDRDFGRGLSQSYYKHGSEVHLLQAVLAGPQVDRRFGTGAFARFLEYIGEDQTRQRYTRLWQLTFDLSGPLVLWKSDSRSDSGSRNRMDFDYFTAPETASPKFTAFFPFLYY